MKKIKYILVLLSLILFISGCTTERKLNCYMIETDIGTETEKSVSMHFINDKLTSADKIIKTKATTNVIKRSWDTYSKTLEEGYNLNQPTGITLSINNDKEQYLFSATYNIDLTVVSSLDLQNSKIDEFINPDLNFEEIIKGAIESGYTCE